MGKRMRRMRERTRAHVMYPRPPLHILQITKLLKSLQHPARERRDRTTQTFTEHQKKKEPFRESAHPALRTGAQSSTVKLNSPVPNPAYHPFPTHLSISSFLATHTPITRHPTP